MAKGTRLSTQEKLNKVKDERETRQARFNKLDEPLAKKQRELEEQLVRERVTADYASELDAKIAEELAKLDNGDAGQARIEDGNQLAFSH